MTGIQVRTDDLGVKKVKAVETPHGTIETPCVVNCAGEGLLNRFFLKLKMQSHPLTRSWLSVQQAIPYCSHILQKCDAEGEFVWTGCERLLELTLTDFYVFK